MKQMLIDSILMMLGHESVEGVTEIFKMNFEEYCYGVQTQEDPTMEIVSVELKTEKEGAFLYIDGKEDGEPKQFRIMITAKERWE